MANVFDILKRKSSTSTEVAENEQMSKVSSRTVGSSDSLQVQGVNNDASAFENKDGAKASGNYAYGVESRHETQETASPFTIPKLKRGKQDLFMDISTDSREWQQEILPVLTKYFRFPALSRYEFLRVSLIQNAERTQKYLEKRKEMRQSGYSERDTADSFAFLYVDDDKQIDKISREGLRVGNLSSSTIGHPGMGAQLCRYMDTIRITPFVPGSMGKLLVFKVMKGKVKAVTENRSGPSLEPTPNYDCHMAKSSLDITPNSSQQLYELYQVYLYEYGEDQSLEPYPRHVLPYAVISFRYKEAPPSPRLLESPPIFSPRLSSPPVPKFTVSAPKEADDPEYVIWCGHLRVKDILDCEVKMVSTASQYKPAHLGTVLNVRDTCEMKVAGERYFKELSCLRKSGEVYWKGWYINVAELRPKPDSKTQFLRLMNHLGRTDNMAVLKPENDVVLLLAPNSGLTNELGLTRPHHYPTMFHCIFLSRQSSKFKSPGYIQKGLHHQKSGSSTPTWFDPGQSSPLSLNVNLSSRPHTAPGSPAVGLPTLGFPFHPGSDRSPGYGVSPRDELAVWTDALNVGRSMGSASSPVSQSAEEKDDVPTRAHDLLRLHRSLSTDLATQDSPGKTIPLGFDEGFLSAMPPSARIDAKRLKSAFIIQHQIQEGMALSPAETSPLCELPSDGAALLVSPSSTGARELRDDVEQDDTITSSTSLDPASQPVSRLRSASTEATFSPIPSPENTSEPDDTGGDLGSPVESSLLMVPKETHYRTKPVYTPPPNIPEYKPTPLHEPPAKRYKVDEASRHSSSMPSVDRGACSSRSSSSAASMSYRGPTLNVPSVGLTHVRSPRDLPLPISPADSSTDKMKSPSPVSSNINTASDMKNFLNSVLEKKPKQSVSQSQSQSRSLLTGASQSSLASDSRFSLQARNGFASNQNEGQSGVVSARPCGAGGSSLVPSIIINIPFSRLRHHPVARRCRKRPSQTADRLQQKAPKCTVINAPVSQASVPVQIHPSSLSRIPSISSWCASVTARENRHVDEGLGSCGQMGGEVGEDAGGSPRDSGEVGEDAGGSPRDSGEVGEDAGGSPRDSGEVGEDAGGSPRDSGDVPWSDCFPCGSHGVSQHKHHSFISYPLDDSSDDRLCDQPVYFHETPLQQSKPRSESFSHECGDGIGRRNQENQPFDGTERTPEVHSQQFQTVQCDEASKGETSVPLDVLELINRLKTIAKERMIEGTVAKLMNMNASREKSSLNSALLVSNSASSGTDGKHFGDSQSSHVEEQCCESVEEEPNTPLLSSPSDFSSQNHHVDSVTKAGDEVNWKKDLKSCGIFCESFVKPVTQSHESFDTPFDSCHKPVPPLLLRRRTGSVKEKFKVVKTHPVSKFCADKACTELSPKEEISDFYGWKPKEKDGTLKAEKNVLDRSFRKKKSAFIFDELEQYDPDYLSLTNTPESSLRTWQHCSDVQMYMMLKDNGENKASAVNTSADTLDLNDITSSIAALISPDFQDKNAEACSCDDIIEQIDKILSESNSPFHVAPYFSTGPEELPQEIGAKTGTASPKTDDEQVHQRDCHQENVQSVSLTFTPATNSEPAEKTHQIDNMSTCADQGVQVLEEVTGDVKILEKKKRGRQPFQSRRKGGRSNRSGKTDQNKCSPSMPTDLEMSDGSSAVQMLGNVHTHSLKPCSVVVTDLKSSVLQLNLQDRYIIRHGKIEPLVKSPHISCNQNGSKNHDKSSGSHSPSKSETPVCERPMASESSASAEIQDDVAVSIQLEGNQPLISSIGSAAFADSEPELKGKKKSGPQAKRTESTQSPRTTKQVEKCQVSSDKDDDVVVSIQLEGSQPLISRIVDSEPELKGKKKSVPQTKRTESPRTTKKAEKCEVFSDQQSVHPTCIQRASQVPNSEQAGKTNPACSPNIPKVCTNSDKKQTSVAGKRKAKQTPKSTSLNTKQQGNASKNHSWHDVLQEMSILSASSCSNKIPQELSRSSLPRIPKKTKERGSSHPVQKATNSPLAQKGKQESGEDSTSDWEKGKCVVSKDASKSLQLRKTKPVEEKGTMLLSVPGIHTNRDHMEKKYPCYGQGEMQLNNYKCHPVLGVKENKNFSTSQNKVDSVPVTANCQSSFRTPSQIHTPRASSTAALHPGHILPESGRIHNSGRFGDFRKASDVQGQNFQIFQSASNFPTQKMPVKEKIDQTTFERVDGYKALLNEPSSIGLKNPCGSKTSPVALGSAQLSRDPRKRGLMNRDYAGMKQAVPSKSLFDSSEEGSASDPVFVTSIVDVFSRSPLPFSQSPHVKDSCLDVKAQTSVQHYPPSQSPSEKKEFVSRKHESALHSGSEMTQGIFARKLDQNVYKSTEASGEIKASQEDRLVKNAAQEKECESLHEEKRDIDISPRKMLDVEDILNQTRTGPSLLGAEDGHSELGQNLSDAKCSNMQPEINQANADVMQKAAKTYQNLLENQAQSAICVLPTSVQTEHESSVHEILQNSPFMGGTSEVNTTSRSLLIQSPVSSRKMVRKTEQNFCGKNHHKDQIVHNVLKSLDADTLGNFENSEEVKQTVATSSSVAAQKESVIKAGVEQKAASDCLELQASNKFVATETIEDFDKSYQSITINCVNQCNLETVPVQTVDQPHSESCPGPTVTKDVGQYCSENAPVQAVPKGGDQYPSQNCSVPNFTKGVGQHSSENAPVQTIAKDIGEASVTEIVEEVDAYEILDVDIQVLGQTYISDVSDVLAADEKVKTSEIIQECSAENSMVIFHKQSEQFSQRAEMDHLFSGDEGVKLTQVVSELYLENLELGSRNTSTGKTETGTSRFQSSFTERLREMGPDASTHLSLAPMFESARSPCYIDKSSPAGDAPLKLSTRLESSPSNVLSERRSEGEIAEKDISPLPEEFTVIDECGNPDTSSFSDVIFKHFALASAVRSGKKGCDLAQSEESLKGGHHENTSASLSADSLNDRTFKKPHLPRGVLLKFANSVVKNLKDNTKADEEKKSRLSKSPSECGEPSSAEPADAAGPCRKSASSSQKKRSTSQPAERRSRSRSPIRKPPFPGADTKSTRDRQRSKSRSKSPRSKSPQPKSRSKSPRSKSLQPKSRSKSPRPKSRSKSPRSKSPGPKSRSKSPGSSRGRGRSRSPSGSQAGSPSRNRNDREDRQPGPSRCRDREQVMEDRHHRQYRPYDVRYGRGRDRGGIRTRYDGDRNKPEANFNLVYNELQDLLSDHTSKIFQKRLEEKKKSLFSDKCYKNQRFRGYCFIRSRIPSTREQRELEQACGERQAAEAEKKAARVVKKEEDREPEKKEERTRLMAELLDKYMGEEPEKPSKNEEGDMKSRSDPQPSSTVSSPAPESSGPPGSPVVESTVEEQHQSFPIPTQVSRSPAASTIGSGGRSASDTKLTLENLSLIIKKDQNSLQRTVFFSPLHDPNSFEQQSLSDTEPAASTSKRLQTKRNIPETLIQVSLCDLQNEDGPTYYQRSVEIVDEIYRQGEPICAYPENTMTDVDERKQGVMEAAGREQWGHVPSPATQKIRSVCERSVYKKPSPLAVHSHTIAGTGSPCYSDASAKTPVGDEYPPGGDQYPPGGDQYPPGGDQYPPSGDQCTQVFQSGPAHRGPHTPVSDQYTPVDDQNRRVVFRCEPAHRGPHTPPGPCPEDSPRQRTPEIPDVGGNGSAFYHNKNCGGTDSFFMTADQSSAGSCSGLEAASGPSKPVPKGPGPDFPPDYHPAGQSYDPRIVRNKTTSLTSSDDSRPLSRTQARQNEYQACSGLQAASRPSKPVSMSPGRSIQPEHSRFQSGSLSHPGQRRDPRIARDRTTSAPVTSGKGRSFSDTQANQNQCEDSSESWIDEKCIVSPVTSFMNTNQYSFAVKSANDSCDNSLPGTFEKSDSSTVLKIINTAKLNSSVHHDCRSVTLSQTALHTDTATHRPSSLTAAETSALSASSTSKFSTTGPADDRVVTSGVHVEQACSGHDKGGTSGDALTGCEPDGSQAKLNMDHLVHQIQQQLQAYIARVEQAGQEEVQVVSPHPTPPHSPRPEHRRRHRRRHRHRAPWKLRLWPYTPIAITFEEDRNPDYRPHPSLVNQGDTVKVTTHGADPRLAPNRPVFVPGGKSKLTAPRPRKRRVLTSIKVVQDIPLEPGRDPPKDPRHPFRSNVDELDLLEREDVDGDHSATSGTDVDKQELESTRRQLSEDGALVSTEVDNALTDLDSVMDDNEDIAQLHEEEMPENQEENASGKCSQVIQPEHIGSSVKNETSVCEEGESRSEQQNSIPKEQACASQHEGYNPQLDSELEESNSERQPSSCTLPESKSSQQAQQQNSVVEQGKSVPEHHQAKPTHQQSVREQQQHDLQGKENMEHEHCSNEGEKLGQNNNSQQEENSEQLENLTEHQESGCRQKKNSEQENLKESSSEQSENNPEHKGDSLEQLPVEVLIEMLAHLSEQADLNLGQEELKREQCEGLREQLGNSAEQEENVREQLEQLENSSRQEENVWEQPEEQMENSEQEENILKQPEQQENSSEQEGNTWEKQTGEWLENISAQEGNIWEQQEQRGRHSHQDEEDSGEQEKSEEEEIIINVAAGLSAETSGSEVGIAEGVMAHRTDAGEHHSTSRPDTNPEIIHSYGNELLGQSSAGDRCQQSLTTSSPKISRGPENLHKRKRPSPVSRASPKKKARVCAEVEACCSELIERGVSRESQHLETPWAHLAESDHSQREALNQELMEDIMYLDSDQSSLRSGTDSSCPAASNSNSTTVDCHSSKPTLQAASNSNSTISDCHSSSPSDPDASNSSSTIPDYHSTSPSDPDASNSSSTIPDYHSTSPNDPDASNSSSTIPDYHSTSPSDPDASNSSSTIPDYHSSSPSFRSESNSNSTIGDSHSFSPSFQNASTSHSNIANYHSPSPMATTKLCSLSAEKLSSKTCAVKLESVEPVECDSNELSRQTTQEAVYSSQVVEVIEILSSSDDSDLEEGEIRESAPRPLFKTHLEIQPLPETVIRDGSLSRNSSYEEGEMRENPEEDVMVIEEQSAQKTTVAKSASLRESSVGKVKISPSDQNVDMKSTIPADNSYPSSVCSVKTNTCTDSPASNTEPEKNLHGESQEGEPNSIDDSSEHLRSMQDTYLFENMGSLPSAINSALLELVGDIVPEQTHAPDLVYHSSEQAARPHQDVEDWYYHTSQESSQQTSHSSDSAAYDLTVADIEDILMGSLDDTLLSGSSGGNVFASEPQGDSQHSLWTAPCMGLPLPAACPPQEKAMFHSSSRQFPQRCAPNATLPYPQYLHSYGARHSFDHCQKADADVRLQRGVAMDIPETVSGVRSNIPAIVTPSEPQAVYSNLAQTVGTQNKISVIETSGPHVGEVRYPYGPAMTSPGNNYVRDAGTFCGVTRPVPHPVYQYQNTYPSYHYIDSASRPHTTPDAAYGARVPSARMTMDNHQLNMYRSSHDAGSAGAWLTESHPSSLSMESRSLSGGSSGLSHSQQHRNVGRQSVGVYRPVPVRISSQFGLRGPFNPAVRNLVHPVKQMGAHQSLNQVSVGMPATGNPVPRNPNVVRQPNVFQ